MRFTLGRIPSGSSRGTQPEPAAIPFERLSRRSPVRILSIANVPLDERTGSGYIVTGFARELVSRGHGVTLIGSGEHSGTSHVRRGERYRQMVGMTVAALRHSPDGFDVVELYGGEAWLAIELLRRIPERDFLLVSHSNGIEPHCAERLAKSEVRRDWYQLDLSALFARGFRGADAVVTVSEFDADFVRRRGYSSRVLAIANPLPEVFHSLEPPADRDRRVGYFGSWSEIKGRRSLVEALAGFLARHPGWEALLVGVGEASEVLRDFPERVRGRIEVVPAASRNDLPLLYDRCAITVAPSLYESFGLTMAEALSRGCALVASRVGIAWDLTHGRDAYLLDPPTPASLLAALCELAASEQLRQTLGSNGSKRVQGLTWSAAAAQLEDAYQNWLGEIRVRRH